MAANDLIAAEKIDCILIPSKVWYQSIRSDIRPLAATLLEKCDWSWVPPRFDENALRMYQLFLLCKIAVNDWSVNEHTKRPSLSPTTQIDALWHEHMQRPVTYMNLFCTLFSQDAAKGVVRVLDHSPEGADDNNMEKNERLKRTLDYMQLLLPED